MEEKHITHSGISRVRNRNNTSVFVGNKAVYVGEDICDCLEELFILAEFLPCSDETTIILLSSYLTRLQQHRERFL